MKYFYRSLQYLVLMLFIVSGSVFAKENIFSTADKIEKENSARYYQDASEDIYKKYNNAAKNSSDPAIVSLVRKCEGGDLFMPLLDDLSANLLPGLNNNLSYMQIAPSLNKKIGYLTTEEQIALTNLMIPSLQSVKKQADFLISTQKDLDSPGRYIDGDTRNSPYDLVDDMQRVGGVFMQNPPQYDGYINTMQGDAAGIITGRFETGNWAQGPQYEIDLASDIASVLGQKKDGSGNTSGGGSDCEDGFCITLDIITSDGYASVSSGRGGAFIDTNFEEIFSSGLDWLIQKGDKRNLACKSPPPKNHFQSNNDLNLFFKNIFRGLGIFIFQKTPPYANSNVGSRSERTSLQKEKDTDDTINTSLKNYNVDRAHLLLGTREQTIEGTTPWSATYMQSALNVEKSVRQERDYQRAKQNGGSLERKAIGSQTNEVVKNDGRMVESWMKSMGTMTKDLGDIGNNLASKPPCEN